MLLQLIDKQAAVRASVDEDRSAGPVLDQRRIPLADVEDGYSV